MLNWPIPVPPHPQELFKSQKDWKGSQRTKPLKILRLEEAFWTTIQSTRVSFSSLRLWFSQINWRWNYENDVYSRGKKQLHFHRWFQKYLKEILSWNVFMKFKVNLQKKPTYQDGPGAENVLCGSTAMFSENWVSRPLWSLVVPISADTGIFLNVKPQSRNDFPENNIFLWFLLLEKNSVKWSLGIFKNSFVYETSWSNMK